MAVRGFGGYSTPSGGRSPSKAPLRRTAGSNLKRSRDVERLYGGHLLASIPTSRECSSLRKEIPSNSLLACLSRAERRTERTESLGGLLLSCWLLLESS